MKLKFKHQAFQSEAVQAVVDYKTIHNKIYRLDALDAYNQKLVKKMLFEAYSLRDYQEQVPIFIWNPLKSRSRVLSRGWR